MPDEVLNPLQQQVLDTLRIPGDWAPLPGDIVSTVEEQLTEALSVLDGRFTPENPLRVNKHFLSTIHGCEEYHMEQRRAPFAWNINTVRGTMVHKAVELLVNWRGNPIPAEVVDAAIDSVVHNPRESAGEFVASLTAHELAELRGAVVNALANFLECFPPVKASWRPLVEYSATYSLFNRSVLFTARMDLVLGAVGRKVIIDLKTGRITSTHRDDLRFYALVETLRSRQPPRSLGTYSLDAARLDYEEVSEGLLQAAVRRTSDGVLLMADLVLKERVPERRGGPQCRWCPLVDSCDTGLQYLEALDGDNDN